MILLKFKIPASHAYQKSMSQPEISSGGKSSSCGYLSKLDASEEERICKINVFILIIKMVNSYKLKIKQYPSLHLLYFKGYLISVSVGYFDQRVDAGRMLCSPFFVCFCLLATSG